METRIGLVDVKQDADSDAFHEAKCLVHGIGTMPCAQIAAPREGLGKARSHNKVNAGAC